MKRWMKKSAALALALILLMALLPGGALAASLTVSSLNANKTTAVTGDSVTWTAAAAGGSGTIKYCFYVFKDGKIVERGSYGAAKTYTYTPAAAGTYTARVYVKDAAGTVATKEGAAVAVSAGALTILSLTPDKSSVSVGDAVTWTAEAAGGSGTLKYCFYVFKDGKIAERGSYGTAKTYTYTPAAAGIYTARVYVKDAAGTVVNQMSSAVEAAAAPITVSLTVDKSRATLNEGVKWTATASGGTGSFQYCFYVFKNGKIKERGSYGAANVYNYTPTEAGTYTVRVYVKDSAGTVKTQEGGQCVAFAPIVITGLEPSITEGFEGEPITWTASAVGGSGGLEYNFYIYRSLGKKQNEVIKKSGWTTDTSCWVYGDYIGYYNCRVYVRDKAGTQVSYDCPTTVTLELNGNDYDLYIYSFEPDPMSDSVTGGFIWNLNAASAGPLTYEFCFYVFCNGKVVDRGPWQDDQRCFYTATELGTYTCRVFWRDKEGFMGTEYRDCETQLYYIGAGV